MEGQNVGYRRVSKEIQTIDRQLEGITFDKVFDDRCSAKSLVRPEFEKMMLYLREGDSLTVHSLDRLARNVIDLHNVVGTLIDRGVSVKFLKEGLLFSSREVSAMNMLLFTVMGAFAQFERELMIERTREGMAIAKAKGLLRGGKPKLNADQIKEMKELLNQGLSKVRVAKKFQITRQTVYYYLKNNPPPM